MFIKASPESVGIHSENLLKYLKMINFHSLSAHSVLIARGDKLILEAYWKPFDKDECHRMYSQTKSYVGLAVRLLTDEGKISLDDKIISYFPDKLPEKIHPYLEKLTVRNMLMMRTCFDEYDVSWFTSGTDDRVKLYFSQRPAVYPGTQFRYDSNGSFVLGALVERLTGKTFLDYLREKCLDEIGFSEKAHVLYCPGGYAWADSALLCTPRDMLSYGYFVGHQGMYGGKQIIRKGIIGEALEDLSSSYDYGFRSFDSCGYASQFWRFYGKTICFNGMHSQYTVYDPETDITFTCTSGNYRTPAAGALMIAYLFSEIIEKASDILPENEKALSSLNDYVNSLSLTHADGKEFSSVENQISGKIFKAEENEAGIEYFSFEFLSDRCVFKYKNAQGEKELTAGRNKNIFGIFPQDGYSDKIGGKKCEVHKYKCASSFCWGTENQLHFITQIIDEYIGNLYINFSFCDGHGRIQMTGDAENFLKEYNGKINAIIRN